MGSHFCNIFAFPCQYKLRSYAKLAWHVACGDTNNWKAEILAAVQSLTVPDSCLLEQSST